MTFKQVILAIEGLQDRDKVMQLIFRKMTYIIGATGMNNKGFAGRFEKMWPNPDKRKSNVSERAKQTLRKFQEIDAKARANGRRT